MCIGETKHSPSTTPLRRTIASTSGVRCTISYRFRVVRVRYSVCAFIPAMQPPGQYPIYTHPSHPMIADHATPERLGAFSDGVIAIIITIMVLDLHAPHDP